MKNIFKSILVMSAAALVAVSCNVDNVGTLYEPDGNGTGISFIQTVVSENEISASQATFAIPVGRRSADGPLTVNIKSTLPDGVKVPSSVTFNAGEYQTDLLLDISGMKVGSSYKGNVSFAEGVEFDSNTANSTVSVTLAKAYTWESIGTGEFLEYFWEGYAADVEFLKAEGFDIYRIMNPYAEASAEEADATGPKPAYIQFEVMDNKGTVHFDTWTSPYDYQGKGYVKFYRPSERGASYAQYDDKSMIADGYYVALMPYVYIDGVGGWGVDYEYTIGAALPGAPKSIEEWFDEHGLL